MNEAFYCQNIFVVALRCTTDQECSGLSGPNCVVDYCQPLECTTTGQCVHGQVCSQNSGGVCVCK